MVGFFNFFFKSSFLGSLKSAKQMINCRKRKSLGVIWLLISEISTAESCYTCTSKQAIRDGVEDDSPGPGSWAGCRQPCRTGSPQARFYT